MRGAFYALLVAGHRRAVEARRAGRRSAYLAWSAAAALLATIAGVVILGMVGLFVHVGWWWAAIPLAYLAMVPLFAHPIAEQVASRMGAPRLAYFLGKRAIASGGEPEAVALVWAARAVACRPSDETIAWVIAARDKRGRIGDAEVVATGLVMAARGDRDGARAMIESAAELAELHPAVRELAGEWLAADDAERGAWTRILDRAAQPACWPATPTTYLLEGIAARFEGDAGAKRGSAEARSAEPSATARSAAARTRGSTPSAGWDRPPSREHLIARWLEAPRRAMTWPIVRRAIDAKTAAAPTTATTIVEEIAHVDPLAAAKAAHAALANGHVSADALAATAAAWDRALADADTRIGVLARAAALGAPSDAGDRALRELAEAAAADLAETAETHGIALAALSSGSPLLARAAARVRHRLLGDLELAFQRLADRCAHKEPLPSIDEWRELHALRDAYDRAAQAGGLELRRLAFVHAHLAVGRLAVWLWNDRGEHVLSHAMSAWLASEALEVGDAQALETHAQNARLRVPMRPQPKRLFSR
ncbi:MAG TPA: hypothetical protein VL463_14700 [Kofleriaceae bacterium]|nr:hypothetical protein [Kofleriaceae bacterium]